MINLTKLQKARQRDDGVTLARCPACAETGKDESGDNLVIYPGGKFTCLAHEQDAVHRQRIFALAGDRLRPTVRPFPVCEPKIIIKNVFELLKTSAAGKEK
jgi:hypothetical protein